MSRLLLVGGGSCSGKSTFSRQLVDHLPPGRVCMLSVDDYYRDNASLHLTERRTINFDEPSAIEHELLLAQVQELLVGRPVQRPHYNFATHSRDAEPRPVEPAPVLLVEGIFALCYPQLRELAALRVFVTADRETRRVRRLERDVERGRERAFIEQQLDDTVLPMHDLHVEPTALHADLLVPGIHPFDRVLDVLACWLTRDPQ